jgi:hypothetical protein
MINRAILIGGTPIGVTLSERAGLIAGHLYYLIPLRISQDEFINCNNNMNRRYFARASDHGISRASSRLQPESSTDIRRDSIKQEEANDPRRGVRIVFSSYSTDGSTGSTVCEASIEKRR